MHFHTFWEATKNSAVSLCLNSNSDVGKNCIILNSLCFPSYFELWRIQQKHFLEIYIQSYKSRTQRLSCGSLLIRLKAWLILWTKNFTGLPSQGWNWYLGKNFFINIEEMLALKLNCFKLLLNLDPSMRGLESIATKQLNQISKSWISIFAEDVWQIIRVHRQGLLYLPIFDQLAGLL